jgi:hypothetical protein
VVEAKFDKYLKQYKPLEKSYEKLRVSPVNNIRIVLQKMILKKLLALKGYCKKMQ